MRVTIKMKLAAAFVVVVAVSAVSMFIALQNLGGLDDSFNAAMDGGVARMLLAENIQNDTLALSRDESRNILSTDAAEDQQLVGAMDHDIAGIKDQAAKLRSLAEPAGQAAVDKFTAAFGDYLAQHAQIVKLADAGQNAQAPQCANARPGGNPGGRAFSGIAIGFAFDFVFVGGQTLSVASQNTNLVVGESSAFEFIHRPLRLRVVGKDSHDGIACLRGHDDSPSLKHVFPGGMLSYCRIPATLRKRN